MASCVDEDDRYAPPFVSSGLPGTLDPDGLVSLRSVSHGVEDIAWLATFEQFFAVARERSGLTWEARGPAASRRTCSALLALIRKFFEVHEGRRRVVISDDCVIALAREGDEASDLADDEHFYLFVDCRRPASPPETAAVRHLVLIAEQSVGGLKRDADLETAWFPAATVLQVGALDSCERLLHVSLPEARIVEIAALYGCANLKCIDLPSLVSLWDYALCRCLSLTHLYLPNATYVAKYALYECKDLRDVNFPLAMAIGNFALAKCARLESAHLPSASTLGMHVFKGCRRLLRVTLKGLADPPRHGRALPPEALARTLLGRDAENRARHPESPPERLPFNLICNYQL